MWIASLLTVPMEESDLKLVIPDPGPSLAAPWGGGTYLF